MELLWFLGHPMNERLAYRMARSSKRCYNLQLWHLYRSLPLLVEKVTMTNWRGCQNGPWNLRRTSNRTMRCSPFLCWLHAHNNASSLLPTLRAASFSDIAFVGISEIGLLLSPSPRTSPRVQALKGFLPLLKRITLQPSHVQTTGL